MNSIAQQVEKEQHFSERIKKFFREYEIGKALHSCNAHKKKGFSVVEIIMYLFSLVFMNRSMFADMNSERKRSSFHQDTAYRLKNADYVNWTKLTMLVSEKIITKTIQPTISAERKTAFVFDDTVFERNRSKKVELLAKIYDHARHKSVRGFQMLTMCWTDGATCLPLSNIMVSTANKEMRINEAEKKEANSLGAKRRKWAQTEKPKLVPIMLKEALDAGIKADYVLFDSWFCGSELISDITKMGLHVVCMAKRGTKKYIYKGEYLDCKEIYNKCKKRRGRSKYLLSVDVKIPYQPKKVDGVKPEDEEIPAKLVYVRNRNKRKEWLLLVCTDTSLSEKEIIALYGKRWDIEVFFKTCKSVLKLTSECRSMNYDAICAHTAIVFLRYMFLAVELRKEQDARTAGPLFCLICDEIADVTFGQSFEKLQQIWENLLRELKLPEEQIDLLFQNFRDSLPSELALMLGLLPNYGGAA